MKIVLTAIVLLLLSVSAGAGERPKVVIVLIDGIPADVVESVSTPALDDIAGESGYTRAYVGGTPGEPSESPTVSSVGYSSLMTGTWSYKNNVWSNAIEAPNYDYWDMFRVAKHHDSQLVTSIYSTWTDNRTKLIGDGLPAAGGAKLDHYVDGFDLDTERFPVDPDSDYIREIDTVVADAAAAHIEEVGPDLSWVYLQYTDDVAHLYGDSPEFAAAVQFMDQQTGKIWRAVQEREAAHDEDWLVIVTTDHGRDAATGKDHGEQSERERTIWVVTNSDRLNERFYQYPAIVDILPSVAAHLGLTMPDEIRAQLDGQSFID